MLYICEMIGKVLYIGNTYRTTWQSDKGMKFVLSEIDGDRVRLSTLTKSFWTNARDLITIEGKSLPKWKRRLNKKQNVLDMDQKYEGWNPDLNPEKTAEIYLLLKSSLIPY